MPQPSPYWGDEVIWTSKNNVHNPMFDEQGPRVDHVGACVRPRTRRSARGVEPSVGEAVPDRRRGPAPRDVRSEDAEAHAHQHVLRHAPSDVRRGRQPHAVDERRRAGRRLAEHEDVRRDRRRGEVAGLDARSSSTRTATASATRTSSRTSRSIRRRTSGSAARSMPCRRRRMDRCGARYLGFPGAVDPAASRARIRPRRRSRRCTSCRRTIRACR